MLIACGTLDARVNLSRVSPASYGEKIIDYTDIPTMLEAAGAVLLEMLHREPWDEDGERPLRDTDGFDNRHDDDDGVFELYDLRVTVDRIEGRSVCGLEVGDYFELTESSQIRIPAGRHFCLYALQSVLPLLPAKQRVLDPSDWLEIDTFVACPDADERLIMRIERIGRSAFYTEDLT